MQKAVLPQAISALGPPVRAQKCDQLGERLRRRYQRQQQGIASAKPARPSGQLNQPRDLAELVEAGDPV
jgi:hypothetical protein